MEVDVGLVLALSAISGVARHTSNGDQIDLVNLCTRGYGVFAHYTGQWEHS